jgi:hypothetical protein
VLSDTQIKSSSFNLHDFIEALLEPMDKIDVPTFYGRCIVFALLALWGIFLFAYDYRVGEIGTSFMHNILCQYTRPGTFCSRLSEVLWASSGAACSNFCYRLE